MRQPVCSIGGAFWVFMMMFNESAALSTSPARSSSSAARVFLITGATDGIGQHTAQKLASDGHGLIVHGRRPDAGVKLKTDLMKRGAAFVHYLNADLSDLSEVESLAESVSENFDRIDVLINNAGVFDPTPATSKEGYEMTWAVNVMAPFLLTRRLLPLLARGNKPRIITTSSTSQCSTLPDLSEIFARGENVRPNAHGDYSRSKLGDLMFTRELASILSSQKDERLSGIKCLSMDPGTVNTKMLKAGWGACGISVSEANNTYKVAATEFGAEQESGSYHFGFRGGGKDKGEREALLAGLEEHTGCTYSELRDCLIY